jgi:hypothetical protein
MSPLRGLQLMRNTHIIGGVWRSRNHTGYYNIERRGSFNDLHQFAYEACVYMTIMNTPEVLKAI